MTPKDKYINPFTEEEEQGGGDSTGEGTSGGAGSQIAFVDFIGATDHKRDDLLPASEKKRLLSVHKDTNALRVTKQKETRDVRKALKDGKISLQTYRQGLGLGNTGMRSQYKANPALKDKAQFSGIDRQENVLPTENNSATNEEQRNELQNRLENRLTNTPQPRFNPKPHFP